jgi:hypothetical protein
MPTQTIQQFAGLDLRSDAQEIAGAIDCLNVDFDREGRVRTRDGYTQFSAGNANLVVAMANQGTMGNLVTLGTNRGGAFNSSGVLIANSNAVAAISGRIVNFGTTTASYVYGPTGDALGRLLRWDGAAWAYPNVGYSYNLVGVTPWDNRLVLLSEFSPATNPHRVRFSDPGAPETYTANSYVDLTPGDNETINAVCEWRDKLFVFKQTKYFVFYGTSTDSTGQPIFNYRTVQTGIGVSSSGFSGGAVAMDEAVYFINNRGMYRTTGGPPQKVSAAVDPLFGIDTAPYFSSSTSSTLGAGPLGRYRQKVLVNGAGATYSLVFDTETGHWSYWNIPATVVLQYYPSNVDALLFADGGTTLFKMGSAYSTDNGTAISSKYRTGFLDFGAPEQEKWIRQMMLSGTGTVNVKTAVNDAVTLSSATSVAMGTSPAVGTGRWSAGTRGRNISVDVSATSGAWSLSHLSLDVAATRAPGVRAA